MSMFRRTGGATLSDPAVGRGAEGAVARADGYSLAEAAAILGVSARRVRQMIEERKLEARRTTLGAFRISGDQLGEERLRRDGAREARTDDGLGRGDVRAAGPARVVPAGASLSGSETETSASQLRRPGDYPAAGRLGRPPRRLLAAPGVVAGVTDPCFKSTETFWLP
jgi:excisionase family DNA binding protein